MDTDIAMALLKSEMKRYPQCNGWKTRWTTARQTLGITEWETRTVGLSKPYVQRADPENVLDTIRHEIGHVLSGKKGAAEKPGGHGPLWVAACEKVGIEPEISGCAPGGTGPLWVGRCCTTRRRSTAPSAESYCPKCGEDIQWEDRSSE